MSQYYKVMHLMGHVAARDLLNRIGEIERLSDAEFRVFSQFGDDGIIQFLIKRCKVNSWEERFIEFGVENYQEANTRFLLINNNWSGLIMDSSMENVTSILHDEISWRHDLQAVRAFITRDNINEIIKDTGFADDLGIMSIDIDGVDYWIWNAIEVCRPVIMICEYNSIFGSSAKVTVQYAENFDRRAAHHTHLYYGASLNALVHLATQKGYCFVGSNSAGNNAYFVRADRLNGLPALSAEQGYVESKIREARNETGQLTLTGGSSRLKLIENLPIFDLESNSMRPIWQVVSAVR
ncbi:hypothetical protein [Methylobacterium sp. PvR107]|uniref:hypothetical protein n=1 Tax=Methylobacterium sp. PvR107 TaxID=2806597 RepID=UPI001AE841C8|nr:hypothetical protein [Methylobacterium sp. PvR107]MBP1178948.1 hypothetical protein [Methylobacterium sp. PvR107]